MMLCTENPNMQPENFESYSMTAGECLAVKATHRNHFHPYTLISKRGIKITIPFTTVTRGIKFLRINLGKDLSAELNKAWRKQIKRDKINGYTFLFDLEIQYCENVYDTKSSLQIQSNFLDITDVIFHRTRLLFFFFFNNFLGNVKDLE